MGGRGSSSSSARNNTLKDAGISLLGGNPAVMITSILDGQDKRKDVNDISSLAGFVGGSYGTDAIDTQSMSTYMLHLHRLEKEYSEAGAWFITNGFEYKRSLYKVNPTEAEKEEIKRREHAGESLMQRGYKYNYKAQDTRDEIIKLEDRRREVYANTAAGIRAQAAATQARRQTAFEGLVKERTRLQTEALQWQNSRAFNREQRERRRKADIELGGSNTKRGQEARRVADKLDASYRDMVDNHIKELTKVINAGVNSPLLDEYLPGH